MSEKEANPSIRLTLIETDYEVVVAWADNPEDWVARFKKDGEFPAHYWAERMQSLYTEKTITPHR